MSTVHLPFEKEQFLQRSGAIHKWISFMLHCFIRRIVLTEHSWMILSIFLTLFSIFLNTEVQNFHVLRCNKCYWLGPFFFFFLLFLPWPLVRLPTGTKWHWRRALLRITGILLKWHCFTFLHSQHDRCCFFCFSNFWLKREKIILI